MPSNTLTTHKAAAKAHLATLKTMIEAHHADYNKAAKDVNEIFDKYPDARGNYQSPHIAGRNEMRFDLSGEEFLRSVRVAFLRGCMEWHGRSIRTLEQRLCDVNMMEEARVLFGDPEMMGEKEQGEVEEDGEEWVLVEREENQAWEEELREEEGELKEILVEEEK